MKIIVSILYNIILYTRKILKKNAELTAQPSHSCCIRFVTSTLIVPYLS